MARSRRTRPQNGAGIDMRHPNSARVEDYFLGGSANFEVDRVAAREIAEAFPEAEAAIRESRAFLGRAVRFLVDQGIDQFLDLGSGVAAVGNVHGLAHRLDPASRVVYVDSDPVSVAHGRQVLAEVERAEVLDVDLLDVEEVLRQVRETGLVDWERPLGLLLVSVLNFVRDDADVDRLVRGYTGELVPGSYLVLTHATAADLPPETAERVAAVYRRVKPPSWWRSTEQIAALLADLELVPPGIVAPSLWRPEREPGTAPGRLSCRAAVARIP
ncbi:SAM-dependent methyltransferase [Saccharopolyspora sp. MS10]|uniref:SAM-dependent methyltransferase n=1 Tax=Saccharopolyspora sp. MS10 TaxID=3385973 RepID=UPI0039A2288A